MYLYHESLVHFTATNTVYNIILIPVTPHGRGPRILHPYPLPLIHQINTII